MSTQPEASTSAGPASAQADVPTIGLTEGAAAINELYAFFHREGNAYTYNGRSVLRCYCKACLRNEINLVRQARQQYGQGADASLELLQSIALGRIEYFVPNQVILRDHLKNDCLHLSKDERMRFKSLNQSFVTQIGKRYKNLYDYGSVYEVVDSPKLASNDEDLQPGAANAARIFASHEASLLKKAERKRASSARHARAKRLKMERLDTDYIADENASDSDVLDDGDVSESESFEEGQVLPGENSTARPTPQTSLPPLDLSIMYSPTEHSVDDAEPPKDFPSSDLMKSIQKHAGELYEGRGLMSTESHPKTESGTAIPSMIQAMDASALIALGILTEELTKAQVLLPYEPQPLSDFYERRIVRNETTSTVYGLRNWKHGKVVERVLNALPEGSTEGLANSALARVAKEEEGDAR